MIVVVLTTSHTKHTWDRSICIFLFNRTTLQVFVTHLTGALYVQPLWFYKHQNDKRVRSSGDDFNGGSVSYLQFSTDRAPLGYVTKTWSVVLLNKKKYILLSQVYCVWQVVKTPTVILNNPVRLPSSGYGLGTWTERDRLNTFFVYYNKR
jgi:hypothetical protein